jgi:hypothetical protein
MTASSLSVEHAGVQNSPITRGITGGQNAFVLKHENDGAMRGARAMDDSLRNDEALSRLERDGTIFEIDKQLALDHVEELVVCVVLVPVVRTLDDAQPHNGFVHLAERLVIPLEVAGVREKLGVDDFQWFVQNV